MVDPVAGVSPDGSPVAVFLALPPNDGPRMVHDAVGEGRCLLELGCGAGRLTRPLVALGHDVVAVDDTPEMLQHVTGTETVCADLFDLDLGRTFDAVVAASYLINAPDPRRRTDLLAVCRRHLSPGGAAVIQRHDPVWARDPMDGEVSSGPVDVRFRLVQQRGSELDATVTYRLGGRSWIQPFTARIVDDEDLRVEAAAHGLHLERWLDTDRTWALLRATES